MELDSGADGSWSEAVAGLDVFVVMQPEEMVLRAGAFLSQLIFNPAFTKSYISYRWTRLKVELGVGIGKQCSVSIRCIIALLKSLFLKEFNCFIIALLCFSICCVLLFWDPRWWKVQGHPWGLYSFPFSPPQLFQCSEKRSKRDGNAVWLHKTK